jgi:hypothetical protein
MDWTDVKGRKKKGGQANLLPITGANHHNSSALVRRSARLSIPTVPVLKRRDHNVLAALP